MARASSLYLALRVATAFGFALFATVSAIRRVTEVELDPLRLVLVGTALEVTVFLFEIPTGALADLRGRRISVILGYALIGVGFAIESLFPAFAPILLAQGVWGLGSTFVSGAREAWLVDEVGELEAGRLFVRSAQLAALARLAGIVASVSLATVALHVPMRFAGALFVAIAAALWFAMDETGFRPAPEADRARLGRLVAQLGEGARAARGRPVVGLLFAVTLFAGIAEEGIDRLWELHFLTSFSFPAWGGLQPVLWFGVINAGALILSAGALEGLRRRVDPEREEHLARVLAALHGLLVVAVAALAWAGGFAVAVAAYWAITVLRRSEEPYTQAWLNRGLDPRARATVLSMHEQTHSLGEIGGGPALGLAARELGVRAALGAAAAALVPTVALVVRAGRRRLTGAPFKKAPGD